MRMEDEGEGWDGRGLSWWWIGEELGSSWSGVKWNWMYLMG